MPIDYDLSGRTAIVTGASSGIGRAIAEGMGVAGAHVFLSGRTESAMQESAQKIEAAGGQATIHVGDVRDPQVVQALVGSASDADGHLDILVNNAGISFLDSIIDGDPERWRAMLETNVLALLVGCQAAIRAMRASGKPGHIVNVSSVAAANPESGVYGATKHAVNVITNTLRQELLEDPIKVTSIMPGLVATNIGRNVDPAILEGIVALSGLDVAVTPGERLPEDVLDAAQAALSDIMIKPSDVAEAVLFAVCQPTSVQVSQLIVRPNKDFDFGA
jgi:NADP-dependent 3-hydroxy acid dehydrogenase YdfG